MCVVTKAATRSPLILPWPPSILRPNDRSHWAKKNPHKNKYKSDCYYLAAHHAYKWGSPSTVTDDKIELKITFYPPNNRWDWDAQISACKAGFDGIAEAWAVNDKRFKPVIVFEAADKANPRVEIQL